MPPGDVAAGTWLLNGSPPGPPEPGREHTREHAQEYAQFAAPWGEPPARDATLLAVVPIPGTGTSLAIVGYVIATQASQPPASQPPASQPPPSQPPASQPPPSQPSETAADPNSGLHLNHTQRRVWADGREVQLTFQEFELLAFLTAHPARVFSRADLVGQVWHRDLGHDARPVPRDSRTVDVHVSRLRHKLGPRHGQCLITEYRVGYQYRPPPP